MERQNAPVCTKCHGSLYAAGAFAGPSLVQGKPYCEPCAARLRVRTRAALIAAGALTLSGIGGGIVLAATHAVTAGAAGWLLPLAALAEYGVVFGGAIHWMKRRNAAVRGSIDGSSLPAIDVRSPAISRRPSNEG